MMFAPKRKPNDLEIFRDAMIKGMLKIDESNEKLIEMMDLLIGAVKEVGNRLESLEKKLDE